MKQLLTTILALACLFSLVGCDKDSTDSSVAVNNSHNSGAVNNNSNSSETVILGGDDMLNEGGSLKVPTPEAAAECTIDAATWQSLLTEDALRTAMKENSLTMLTADSNAEQYQMFSCAGGRYSCIQSGSTRSETICSTEGETVYIYKKDSADAPWTRTESQQRYDEYVTNHYLNGAMQYLSGLASIFDHAQYSEAEKAYLVQEHTIMQKITGTLKVQFSNGKLHSIVLHLNMDGQAGVLTTVFGTANTPDIPTDFTEGNSSNSIVSSNQNQADHFEPMESVCSETQWKRLFEKKRLLNNLMECHATIKIDNNRDAYLYQMDMNYSRIVMSLEDSYQELFISRDERFQRDSKNGQWKRYSDHNHHREYDTILADNTNVLTQFLTPLENLYGQVSFDGPNRIFTLENVAIEHETFGSTTANYVIMISGDRIEKLEAHIRTDNDTWTLSFKEGKNTEITLPTDYVDMSESTPGKK